MYPLSNGGKYLLHLELDIQVIEPKKVKAKSLKLLLAISVFFLLQEMTVAIKLNHEIEFGAIEVHNVIVNRLLTVEVETHHLFAFQHIPE